jgi:hypothetical protein
MGGPKTSGTLFKMSNGASHSYSELPLANGENALPDRPGRGDSHRKEWPLSRVLRRILVPLHQIAN